MDELKAGNPNFSISVLLVVPIVTLSILFVSKEFPCTKSVENSGCKNLQLTSKVDNRYFQ